jgi:hypothetical protein
VESQRALQVPNIYPAGKLELNNINLDSNTNIRYVTKYVVPAIQPKLSRNYRAKTASIIKHSYAPSHLRNTDPL